MPARTGPASPRCSAPSSAPRASSRAAMRRREGIRVAVQRQVPSRLREMPLTGVEFLRLTGADRRDVPARVEPLLDLRLDRLSGGQYQLLHVWACLGCAGRPRAARRADQQHGPARLSRPSRRSCCLARGGRQGVLVVSHEHDFLERVSTRLVEVRAMSFDGPRRPASSSLPFVNGLAARRAAAAARAPTSACARSGWRRSASPRWRPPAS